MQGQKLAAIYPSRSQAEAARSALLENGVSVADIRLSSEQDNSAPAGEAPQPEVGFLDWLFGTLYLPKKQAPRSYGISDPVPPDSYLGQLAYPFRTKQA